MEGTKQTAKVFPVVPCDRTRGHGQKLKCWRFPLNIRKHVFYGEGEQLKCCIVFLLGNVQKLSGHGSGHPAQGWWYLRFRVESGDFPSKPIHAAILDAQCTVHRLNCDTINLIQLFNRTTPILLLTVPYRVNMFMNLDSENLGTLYRLQQLLQYQTFTCVFLYIFYKVLFWVLPSTVFIVTKKNEACSLHKIKKLMSSKHFLCLHSTCTYCCWIVKMIKIILGLTQCI